MSTWILVVDDEPQLADLVARRLRREGYLVETAADGIEALTYAAERPFDLAVVDVSMPGMTGFELCRRLKQSNDTIRVLMLSARDAVDDRVHGLDAGADDYLVKPFDFAELFARLRVLTRRDSRAQLRFVVGDLTLSVDRATVSVGGQVVQLSRREFDLLRMLAQRPDETIERGELMDEVWGSEHYRSNVIDQYVAYLRRKLETAGAASHIVTDRGVGFRFVAERAEAERSET